MHLAFARRTGLVAITLLTPSLLGAPVHAQARPTFEHLRPIDTLGQELLYEAWHRSRIVQTLVLTLERSDVFVQIEVRSQEEVRGRVRFLNGSPECRWVRLTLRVPANRSDLLATFAHELQHAVEIARARGVRDRRAVQSFFARIGYRVGTHQFETRAALAVEQNVKRELAEQGIFH